MTNLRDKASDSTVQATVGSNREGSEEIFKLLVDAVDEYAIFALDLNGCVTTWNTGAQKIKGYRENEILGKHFSAFYPKSDIDAGKPEMELRIAENEGSYEEEGWRIRKDGSMFWANVTSTALRGSNNKLRGFVQVTRDLTSRRQSEEALRQSQERYKLLVDNIIDYGVMFLDPKGRITSWNTGATRITGFEAKEILGSHFSKFHTEEDLQTDKPARALLIALQDGRFEEEGKRVRKDGSEYWANVVITAVTDDHGKSLGFSKVTRDITERRKAEQHLRENEERFRLMIEGVEDYAIFMLSPSGHVATWNRGAERNKGYLASEIIGCHFSKFYPQSDLDAGKPDFEIREATAKGRFEDEGWRVRKDGTMFWANVVITAVRDESGRLVGFSKVTRNLTERKKAEDELRAAHAGLERRIVLRTIELSVAKEKAEAAVKMRDQFFSMASHELKTPLSAMKLQTQFRKRNIKKGRLQEFAPENLFALCEEDERQIDRLTFLVDNMLDISRLTSGQFQLNLEHFDLGVMAKDVVERMGPILRQSGNECYFYADAEVFGNWDRIRLEQVLINLLANTGKYAGGKPVEIRIEAASGIARFTVKDHGRGISEVDRLRIFDSFERVGESSTASGLGLGLYISKQIIEAHAGSISVKSELGVGTIFTVELPLNAPVAESAV